MGEPSIIVISSMNFVPEWEGWNVVCSPFGCQYVPINDPDATEEQIIAAIHGMYYVKAGDDTQ